MDTPPAVEDLGPAGVPGQLQYSIVPGHWTAQHLHGTGTTVTPGLGTVHR